MSESNEATGATGRRLRWDGARGKRGDGIDEKRCRLLAMARINEEHARRRDETRTRTDERAEGRTVRPSRRHHRRLPLMGQRKNELTKTAHLHAPRNE